MNERTNDAPRSFISSLLPRTSESEVEKRCAGKHIVFVSNRVVATKSSVAAIGMIVCKLAAAPERGPDIDLSFDSEQTRALTSQNTNSRL